MFVGELIGAGVDLTNHTIEIQWYGRCSECCTERHTMQTLTKYGTYTLGCKECRTTDINEYVIDRYRVERILVAYTLSLSVSSGVKLFADEWERKHGLK